MAILLSLRVSHKITVKISAGRQLFGGLTGAGRSTSKLTCMLTRSFSISTFDTQGCLSFFKIWPLAPPRVERERQRKGERVSCCAFYSVFFLCLFLRHLCFVCGRCFSCFPSVSFSHLSGSLSPLSRLRPSCPSRGSGFLG